MIKKKTIVLWTLCLTLLTGCSSVPLEKKIVVTTTPQERPPLIISQPQETKLENPKYIILTPDNIKIVFEEIKKQGIEPIIIGTTVEGFSVILTNNVKIQQLIQKYQDDIKAQQKYYTTPTN